MKKWVIDPDHSVAGFVIRHMMVTNVRGQFNRIKGTINFDPAEVAHSSLEAAIDVAGITTGIEKRDEHLRSNDFFDVAKYPDMIFKSIRAESTGGNRFRVFGNLTIRGVARPVILEAEFSGPVKGTEGELSIGFSGTTRINREDFGITWNVGLEGGGVVVGKEVQVYIDVEADLAA